MARGHRPFKAIALVGASERLGDRQTVGREVVMAEHTGTVGIVENTQPPCTGRGLLLLGNKGQVRVDAPGRREVAGDLYLQCIGERAALIITHRIAGIDDRDLDLRHYFPAFQPARLAWTAYLPDKPPPIAALAHGPWRGLVSPCPPATNICFVANDSQTRRDSSQSAPSNRSTIGTTRTDATQSTGSCVTSEPTRNSEKRWRYIGTGFGP